MNIQYPTWIPNPATNNGLPEILVEDPATHMARNKEHYDALLAAPEPTASSSSLGSTIPEAIAIERKRASLIAEKYPNGGAVASGIAAAILVEPKLATPLFRDKLLSNPLTKPVADDRFVLEQPDGTFKQPNVFVRTPEQEVNARAKGFTVEINPPTPPAPAVPPKP